jgi:hypothetical protein
VATVPDVDEVRAWLKLAPTSMDDAELGDILAGEVDNQGRMCRIPPEWPADPDAYPHTLRLAVFRRCGRAVAARGVPLGLTGDGEYGPARLPNFDAEIERYEGPLRKFVFG